LDSGGTLGNIQLLQGDCLEVMPTLPMVDAIITDIPYGTTACKWDEIIPFVPMWEQVKRILKPGGVFVTTSSQPFTSKLIMSNLDWFKYEWIWDKRLGGNPLIAKFQPMKIHENILVFSENSNKYYPQMRKGILKSKGGGYSKLWNMKMSKVTNDEYYPVSIVYVSNGDRTREEIADHPTQKPVALYSYLIQTYTNPGDTVLDMCMGSGTTIVAAIQTGRNAIGIEKDAGYFAIAEKRIAYARQQMPLFVESISQPMSTNLQPALEAANA
jgi:site-specific DNA-methyltransferase (adenine-specific)